MYEPKKRELLKAHRHQIESEASSATHANARKGELACPDVRLKLLPSFAEEDARAGCESVAAPYLKIVINRGLTISKSRIWFSDLSPGRADAARRALGVGCGRGWFRTISARLRGRSDLPGPGPRFETVLTSFGFKILGIVS